MARKTTPNPKAGGYGGYIRQQVMAAVPLGTATGCHAAAATLGSGGPQVISTAITNPGTPRNLTATAGGTAGDIKAVQVTVTGTNADGAEISEELPIFTVNTAGIVEGSKAFKTITSYSVPAMDGTGATVAIGFGAKLGMLETMSRNGVLRAFLNGVVEATAPTVAVSLSAVESNTVTLNSALDGTAVIVDYYQT